MADFNVTINSQLLQTYATWAKENKSGAIAGQKQGGAIDNLGNVTSGFARLFGFSSVSTAKQAAIDGFKQALTSAVGSTIADEVWRGVGGEKAKGLTADLIRRGIALANRVVCNMRAALLPDEDMTRFLRMTGAQINGRMRLAEWSPERIKSYGKLNVLLVKADSLFCMSPASKGEAKKIAKLMNVVARELENSISTDLDEKSVHLTMEQVRALRDKAIALKDQTKFLPDGQDPLEGLVQHWRESLDDACHLVRERVKLLDENNVPVKLIQNLDAKLKNLQDFYEADGCKKMRAAIKKKEICGKIEAELAKCIKSTLGNHMTALMKKATEKVFAEAHFSLLNHDRWDPIDKKFEGFIGGKKISLNSQITCGRHIDKAIGTLYDADNGDNGDGYGGDDLEEFDGEEKVYAFNCYTANTHHAVNLATSELAVNGKTVFRGVRHACHNAKVGTNLENAEANKNRAMETVNAAFVEYLKMHPNLKDANGVIDFNVNSISLQTPSNGIKGDHDKFFAQKAAWDAVNNLNEMTVTVNGKDYRVKPHVTTFSYGVNYLALTFKGNLLTGWDNVNAMNKAGLESLFSRAETFVGTCADQKVKNAVETLVAQIKDISKNQLERSAGTEPYKMSARLAVLSYLMGDVPVWNCKSGKDRTGMLDVEAKFLATLIDQGQTIPKPNEKLTTEQTHLLRTILMQSGNLEMQQYNTGAVGYKLDDAPGVFNRLGADSDAEKVIKGGSGYVGR